MQMCAPVGKYVGAEKKSSGHCHFFFFPFLVFGFFPSFDCAKKRQ